MPGTCFLDNGGRRCGRDRREFCYTGYIPEKRCGEDRRSGEDRRNMKRDFEAKNGWPFNKDLPSWTS